MSFMTDEDTQLHDWINGAAAKIITSVDGGKTWGHKLKVFDDQADWPGLVAVGEKGLLVMADKEGAKSRRVVLS